LAPWLDAFGLLAGELIDERAEIARLAASLHALIGCLQDLPDAVTAPLTDLSYAIGERLARTVPDKPAFLAAVREDLTHLPRPGETLHVRVAGAESKLWRVLAETSGLPFACTVIEDDEVVPGSAFVEFQNARLDIGPAAQRALVRAALGLPMPSATGE